MEKNTTYDAWCYYDNKDSYKDTYGVLYQWEAAKKACPDGWHLPTNDEWKKMEAYLQYHGYSYDGNIGHNYIAKSLATDHGWKKSTKKGSVGNSDYPEFRNKSGFSALPGGGRKDSGNFVGLEEVGVWWSSTEMYSKAFHHALFHANVAVFNNQKSKLNGFSVRCIKD